MARLVAASHVAATTLIRIWSFVDAGKFRANGIDGQARRYELRIHPKLMFEGTETDRVLCKKPDLSACLRIASLQFRRRNRATDGIRHPEIARAFNSIEFLHSTGLIGFLEGNQTKKAQARKHDG
jgi:hypothetical protein